jgi:hypothetical protein
MSPPTLILPESSPNIYQFLAKYLNLQKNIGPVEDSMDVAKNNVAGVENNYLNNRQF